MVVSNLIGQRYRRLVDLVGKIWTSPNTCFGLLYGCTGYVMGKLGYGLDFINAPPSCSVGNNAIQFHNNPLTLRRAAITIGNTISYGQGSDPDNYGAYGDREAQVGLHEKAHTLQFQAFGPFFLPLYLAAGGFSGPGGNAFEHSAQNYAKGKAGWWPAARRMSS